MPKPVRVVLFATAREAVGRPRVLRTVPPEGRTLSDLLAELREEYPMASAVLSGCRFARNGRYLTSPRARIRPGDELAIHPPFSGG